MSRALKVHHRNRLKRNRRFYWGRNMIENTKPLGFAINTPAPCSCPMCGNSRRYEGKSINERRFDEYAKSEMNLYEEIE
jgi:hypothetical protein